VSSSLTLTTFAQCFWSASFVESGLIAKKWHAGEIDETYDEAFTIVDCASGRCGGYVANSERGASG
jgi:hypothetical protein